MNRLPLNHQLRLVARRASLLPLGRAVRVCYGEPLCHPAALVVAAPGTAPWLPSPQARTPLPRLPEKAMPGPVEPGAASKCACPAVTSERHRRVQATR